MSSWANNLPIWMVSYVRCERTAPRICRWARFINAPAETLATLPISATPSGVTAVPPELINPAASLATGHASAAGDQRPAQGASRQRAAGRRYVPRDLPLKPRGDRQPSRADRNGAMKKAPDGAGV